VLALCSCDAFVSLSYVVKNKSYKPVKVFVPDYSVNGYNRGRDTTLEIKPHDFAKIGSTLPRISGSFRSGVKKLYKTLPGICGVKIIAEDTTEIACTERSWKLRRGCAVLTYYGPK
jgi:hypothetical protein